MRDLKFEASGHDHFFDAFSKFSAVTEAHMSQILAEVTQRAADGNVQYLELMLSPDHRALALAAKAGYDSDFPALRAKLLDADFTNALNEERKKPGRHGSRQEQTARLRQCA